MQNSSTESSYDIGLKNACRQSRQIQDARDRWEAKVKEVMDVVGTGECCELEALKLLVELGFGPARARQKIQSFRR